MTHDRGEGDGAPRHGPTEPHDVTGQEEVRPRGAAGLDCRRGAQRALTQ